MSFLPAIGPVKTASSVATPLAHIAAPAQGAFAAQLRELLQAGFMARFDADKNGTVTPDEFRGSVAAFRRLDANSDGVITRAEVGQALARIADSAHAHDAALSHRDGFAARRLIESR